jgi:hypothetical protein
MSLESHSACSNVQNGQCNLLLHAITYRRKNSYNIDAINPFTAVIYAAV